MAELTTLAQAQDFGRYVGTVQTEWLEDGRRMRLLSQYEYVDPKGAEWLAPKGWVVDGASIPQLAWTPIGGPFEGKYRDASVLQDVACDQKRRPWEDVHEMFYWGMRASGVERWRAKIMYAAVYYFGPRWPRVVTVHGLPIDQTPVAKSTALSSAALVSSFFLNETKRGYLVSHVGAIPPPTAGKRPLGPLPP
jgi:hypothetical protein